MSRAACSRERLAAQGEHSLRVDVAALGYRAACRVALGDEYRALFLAGVLGIAVVDAAVAQLAVVQVGFLGAFAGQLGHSGHRLALAFALFHLALDGFGHLAVDVEVVVNLLFYEVADVFVYRLAFGSHERGAQFYLRLALKNRLLNVDGDSCHEAVSYVAVLIFAEELLDSAGYVLLEGSLVGTALRGVLAVDERVVLLAVLVGVGESYLDIFAAHMHYGV